MRGDVDYVVKILSTVHPATVDGLSDQQHAVIEQIHERLGGPVSRDDHLLMLRELLCTLSDAHTSLHPDDSDSFFNLPLIWLAGGLYVARNAGPLVQADRVLSLGGIAPAELLGSLGRYVPAENEYWVMVRGEELLARESWLTRLGALDQDGSLSIVVSRDDEEIEVRLAAAESPTAPVAARRAPVRHWVGWEIDHELALGAFHLDQCRPGPEYDRVLGEFFRAVAENDVRTVVVDLRYNPGGNSRVLNEFISYLDVESYRGVGMVVRHSWPAARQRFSPYTVARALSRGVVDEFPPRVITNSRRDPSFSGDVYVLTSPATFSSGLMFALVLSDSGLATVVGEPTGGSPSSYGDILTFTLPWSGLRFTVSYKHFTRPDPDRDPQDSLYPDILVETTIEDFVHGRNPQLERVKDMVGDRAGTGD